MNLISIYRNETFNIFGGGEFLSNISHFVSIYANKIYRHLNIMQCQQKTRKIRFL